MHGTRRRLLLFIIFRSYYRTRVSCTLVRGISRESGRDFWFFFFFVHISICFARRTKVPGSPPHHPRTPQCPVTHGPRTIYKSNNYDHKNNLVVSTIVFSCFFFLQIHRIFFPPSRGDWVKYALEKCSPTALYNRSHSNFTSTKILVLIYLCLEIIGSHHRIIRQQSVETSLNSTGTRRLGNVHPKLIVLMLLFYTVQNYGVFISYKINSENKKLRICR